MSGCDDTIAAIATAPGEAGIAIVRVSGPGSLAIADRVFKGPGAVPSERAAGSFVRGHVNAASGGEIDEVVLLIYRAPHSYTREDVVELQGHGGRVSAGRILSAVLEAGARPAAPGEFTRRAFLNGRIDLMQAEAVADLIRARSDRAAGSALEQLDGRLSDWFRDIYDDLVSVAAGLEAMLDFPEEDLPAESAQGVAGRIGQVAGRLGELLATWDEGHLLREGARVVIAGSPNVGKSTLLNALLGRGRAIVAELPGTTRDTIEEELILDGIPARLVDTAGLREAQCGVEQEGVRRAEASVAAADVTLYVVDASAGVSADDEARLAALDPARAVLVLNKADLATSEIGGGEAVGVPAWLASTVRTSALRREGLAVLREAILDKLRVTHRGEPHAAISERHKQIVQKVLNVLNEAQSQMEHAGDEWIVIAAGFIREALEELGKATGRVYSEELLDHIFSRFCIGK